MEKKTNAITVVDSDIQIPGLIQKDVTLAMKRVINEIDQLFAEIQIASMRAIWDVGRLITEVRDDPDTYLTPAQQSAHVDGESVIMFVFAPIYTVEQLRSAVNMFERYPSEGELKRLLAMRCPDRPRWRLTTSHVQLLSQIPDDTQRAKFEERCAEEAYTARALAHELHEIRGKKKGNAGRPHEAPKGLKQQLQDLLAHQRRFIVRSAHLWLNEESDNIYDDIANASPTKLDETACGYFREIEENFSKLSDQISDHVAMCRKVRKRVFDKLESEQDDDEEEDNEKNSRKNRSHITR